MAYPKGFAESLLSQITNNLVVAGASIPSQSSPCSRAYLQMPQPLWICEP